mgnify:FL=1
MAEKWEHARIYEENEKAQEVEDEMTPRLFISPSRYIQGSGVLSSLPKYAASLGSNLLILTSKGSRKRLKNVFDQLESQNEMTVHVEIFTGECTMEEIRRVGRTCREKGVDVIVGLGGGKVIDTAKAIAHYEGLKLIVAVTTASSDAPCSALSIIYKEDGSLDQLLWLKTNPDIVLADLSVIVRAPAHLLAAGIGDAMATYYEMKECWERDADNFCGGRITLAAKAIAEQCCKTILEDGYDAYVSAQKHCITRAFENVVEANTLLSGLGFESGGICAAHPVNNGLAELPQTHGHMHGEKVAFALLCQFVLTKEKKETIKSVMELFVKVGLPVTLKELGITAITEQELEQTVQIACGDPCIRNLPLRVEEEYVKGAIIQADAMGQEFLETRKQ